MTASAVVSALLLTACGGSGRQENKGGLEKSTVTVAGLPLTDGAALHIAQRRGLFEKEGLKVRIQPVQQSIQALPALAKGQVDVISSANYVTFLQAGEKGTLAPRVLAEGATLSPHMMDVVVPRGSRIKDARDLAGKNVSVNVLNNIQSLTLDHILREGQDGKGAKGPEYRQIPFPQMGVALEKGQVDAAHLAEPFLSEVKRDLGARTVVDGGAAPAEGLPISGYVTTEEFTQRNPRTAAAFQRAVRAAQAIAAKDRGAVEQVLPGYARIKPEEARRITLPGYPRTTSTARLQRLADLMTEQGLLKRKADAASLVHSPGR
ncbi:ABC transporter substrate-binding protein [Streptomyces sp. HNM0574]|uniref:ABC transporter substrate-binding protein n=1 Tax=Streptomyces sp. HNM0574 TaxID=2714954 RepID=UPI00146C6BF7|nr:ABC transporter substrate-binding protein [Streptomyces sp. HNM0574]NLU69383.1 ABC transporter substrate-binding protein [Streptomyces sp. HNM0574]